MSYIELSVYVSSSQIEFNSAQVTFDMKSSLLQNAHSSQTKHDNIFFIQNQLFVEIRWENTAARDSSLPVFVSKTRLQDTKHAYLSSSSGKFLKVKCDNNREIVTQSSSAKYYIEEIIVDFFSAVRTYIVVDAFMYTQNKNNCQFELIFLRYQFSAVGII